MKVAISLTTVMAVVVAAAGLVVRMQQPDAPRPISIKPLTEKFIKDQVYREKKEQAEKEKLERATTAARMVFRHNHCTDDYASIIGEAAVAYGLSARVLAAVVVAESSGNPEAVSDSDVGLMQINTRWHHYSRAELKNPKRNVEIGSKILAKYVRQFGLVEGLHHYNGMGCSDNTYAESVLARAGIGG